MTRIAPPALGTFTFFAVALQLQLIQVKADVEQMENLTRRLSDGYLDLDLLDEQARSVLGMVRADEIVIR
jgi:cell division protein FtsB